MWLAKHSILSQFLFIRRQVLMFRQPKAKYCNKFTNTLRYQSKQHQFEFQFEMH
jgi:hypothetical protein